MILMNENYLRLQGSYLFSEIAKRVNKYQEENPDKKIIRLGIGDVTEPLAPKIIEGLKAGVDDMSKKETFKGYGPETGYKFLKEAIINHDFKPRGINITEDEIIISTGAKEDTGNFQELFSNDIKIALPDPVYPVYVDSNVMAGRSGNFVNGRYENFIYLDSTEENNFLPEIPKEKADLIYLCFPNNPTGQVATKEYLKKWVDYANENKSLILFDAAYEAFIREKDIPHSIFEIEGAENCAVEFRSLSKTAGFTGTRCSYVIIPKTVMVYDRKGNKYSLKDLWFRRQSTKFNGTAYIIQRGAVEAFKEEGRKQINDQIDYYLENAKIIKRGLESIGIKSTGGVNSPYIWFKVPEKFDSWGFFDYLLNRVQIVGTPGAGFGKCGEGYFRLSAFGSRENINIAIDRLKNLF